VEKSVNALWSVSDDLARGARHTGTREDKYRSSPWGRPTAWAMWTAWAIHRLSPGWSDQRLL